MIKANELRIGNWVEYLGEYYPIVSVGLYYVMLEGNALYTEMGKINPIPLTPEMLEKAGFRGDKVWSSNQYQIELIEENDGYHLVIHREYTDGTPKLYLHQLQNVSFFLYGEELEINLDK